MKLPKDFSGRKVVDALVRKLEYRVVHEREVISSWKPQHRHTKESLFQITRASGWVL